MSTFLWPSDDGWPYPDQEGGQVDLDGEVDEDLLVLRAAPPHLFDDLDALERQVITARFGLDGAPVRSMKQLVSELGVGRADLKQALGSGLEKLRTQLRA